MKAIQPIKTFTLATILACIALFVSFANAANVGQLVVVVHKDNPASHVTSADVYDIFLGKRTVWGAGGAITTCDLANPSLPEEKTARAIFTKEFIKKDLRSLKNYWIKMIFSGRGQPPVSFERPEDVIRFVSVNRGAIGYLYENQVTDEVRILTVNSDEGR